MYYLHLLVFNYMTNKTSTIDWIAIVLVILGGINWGIVGLFDFDIIAAIFGQFSGVTRVLYVIIGVGSLYMIATATKFGSMVRHEMSEQH